MAAKRKDPNDGFFKTYPLKEELEKANFVLKLRKPGLRWTVRHIGNSINKDIESITWTIKNDLFQKLIGMKEFAELSKEQKELHMDWFLNEIMFEVVKSKDEILNEIEEHNE